MIIRYDEDSLLLALNIVHFFSTAPIVDFEQENVSWVFSTHLMPISPLDRNHQYFRA